MSTRVIVIVAALFATACQKEIVISQPDYVGKVSIQGIIEPDSLPIVYFNRTTPFLSATTQPQDLVIRGASVKIIGAGSTDLLALDSTYDWVRCRFDYFYRGSIVATSDTEYILEIVSDGELYSATTNTSTLQKANIDSVGYTDAFNDIYGEHEGVIVYFKDISGATNFYRYEQTRPVDTTMRHASIPLSFTNSCIGKDTVTVLEQGRSVYSDQNTDGEQLKVVVEPAYTHREGLETTVKIQSIDKAMYDFYDNIDKQKLGQYNPFVEPSFLPEGQFGSRAIGFFGCRTRSVGVVFVFPE